MKTKNIALILVFSSLIASSPCSGMEYVNNSYNATTTMLKSNMIKARDWANNFINSCREISVLGTIYATLGIYDFNKITGLDEDKLNMYNKKELETGMYRLNKIAQYGLSSPKLEDFFDKLQRQSLRVQSNEQTAPIDETLNPEQTAAIDENLNPEQTAAFEEIEKELNEK